MPDAIEAIKVRQTQACLEQDEAAARACADLLATLAPAERTPFPADGICPDCGCDYQWQVVEDGYMRWTSAQMDPGAQGGSEHDQLAPFLAAFPNGSSDYSESGTDQWIECQGEKCQGVYASPDHVTFS